MRHARIGIVGIALVGAAFVVVVAAVLVLLRAHDRRDAEPVTTRASAHDRPASRSARHTATHARTEPRSRWRHRSAARVDGAASARRAFNAAAAVAQADPADPTASSTEPTAAEYDAQALAAFDAAFDVEARDDEWSTAAEADIAATLASAPGAPALDEVECRSTLCRVELRGEMASLPMIGPFREAGWWIDDGGGVATLLLVREHAEIPFAG